MPAHSAGIDARRDAGEPLADLGLYAAYPIVIDSAPAGAVVILRVYNDGLMQELADLTGLDRRHARAPTP